MKTTNPITLLRHNRLKPPFDNYDKLTLEQLDDLASGGVDPEIQGISSLDGFDPHITEQLKNADIILHAESKRATQTAKQLANLLGGADKLRSDARLNEIYFVPSRLVSKDDPHYLKTLRTKIYEEIAGGGPGAELSSQLEKRMSSLRKDYGGKKVVMVTHGFLIRLMDAYTQHTGNMTEALSHISDVKSVKYMEARHIAQSGRPFFGHSTGGEVIER